MGTKSVLCIMGNFSGLYIIWIGLYIIWPGLSIIWVRLSRNGAPMAFLRPILLQDYFGTILRYYFVTGAEIVPQKGLVTETKHLLEHSSTIPGGTVGYPAQPGLTWRNRRLPSPTRLTWRNHRLPSPTRINLEEPISSGYPAHLGYCVSPSVILSVRVKRGM